jgi:hypothetical protein
MNDDFPQIDRNYFDLDQTRGFDQTEEKKMKTAEPIEIEDKKYGINKPKRTVKRASILHDQD